LTLTHAASNQNGLDPDQVSVTVHSAQTDPTGETVVLTETGNNTGVFQGRVGFERPYTSTTATPVTAGNGKVGVYAEGGRKTELLTATFATLTTTAEYTEPSSTVTGVVTDAGSGSVVAGALVELSGDGVPLRAISRPDGVYSFYDVPSGLYTLVVARDGYVLQTTTVTVP
jgi:hypothetical protein